MKIDYKNHYDVGNISLQGHLHKDKNIPIQDYSSSLLEEKYSFIAVSDGHGGSAHFRSNLGSMFAVNAALESFSKNAKNIKKYRNNLDAFALSVANDIIYLWDKKVKDDLSTFNYDKDERFLALLDKEKEKVDKNPNILYGCTLIASYSFSNYQFIIKIGDGNVVAINQNNKAIKLDSLEDESNVLNKTGSLCSDDVLNHLRYTYFVKKSDMPRALFMFSDGVINSFSNPNMLTTFCFNILNLYFKDGGVHLNSNLKEALDRFSSYSGDDVSCAYMINKD